MKGTFTGKIGRWFRVTGEFEIPDVIPPVEPPPPPPVEPPPVEGKNILFSHDFEDNTIGNYWDSGEWSKDWFDIPENKAMNKDLTEIVSLGDRKCLMSVHPAGTFNPGNGSDGNGLHYKPHLPGAHTQLYMSYDVFFPINWEWTYGNKLPGFNAGHFDSSPEDEAPYSYEWSWGGGMGMSIQKEGNLAAYFYHHNKEHRWGDSLSAHYLMPRGEWTTVTQRVVLNEVGSSNGLIEVFVNGELKAGRYNLKFRNLEEITIDRLKIYTHHGGGDVRWAPQKTQNLYLDNFVVFNYEGEGHDRSPAGRVLT